VVEVQGRQWGTLEAGTRAGSWWSTSSLRRLSDISGANVLLNAHRPVTDRGVALSLAGCHAQLVRLLHVIHIVHVRDVIGVQRAGSTVVCDILGNSAHTDLPSGNGVTPQRDDTAATT